MANNKYTIQWERALNDRLIEGKFSNTNFNRESFDFVYSNSRFGFDLRVSPPINNVDNKEEVTSGNNIVKIYQVPKWSSIKKVRAIVFDPTFENTPKTITGIEDGKEDSPKISRRVFFEGDLYSDLPETLPNFLVFFDIDLDTLSPDIDIVDSNFIFKISELTPHVDNDGIFCYEATLVSLPSEYSNTRENSAVIFAPENKIKLGENIQINNENIGALISKISIIGDSYDVNNNLLKKDIEITPTNLDNEYALNFPMIPISNNAGKIKYYLPYRNFANFIQINEIENAYDKTLITNGVNLSDVKFDLEGLILNTHDNSVYRSMLLHFQRMIWLTAQYNDKFSGAKYNADGTPNNAPAQAQAILSQGNKIADIIDGEFSNWKNTNIYQPNDLAFFQSLIRMCSQYVISNIGLSTNGNNVYQFYLPYYFTFDTQTSSQFLNEPTLTNNNYSWTNFIVYLHSKIFKLTGAKDSSNNVIVNFNSLNENTSGGVSKPLNKSEIINIDGNNLSWNLLGEKLNISNFDFGDLSNLGSKDGDYNYGYNLLGTKEQINAFLTTLFSRDTIRSDVTTKTTNVTWTTTKDTQGSINGSDYITNPNFTKTFSYDEVVALLGGGQFENLQYQVSAPQVQTANIQTGVDTSSGYPEYKYTRGYKYTYILTITYQLNSSTIISQNAISAVLEKQDIIQLLNYLPAQGKIINIKTNAPLENNNYFVPKIITISGFNLLNSTINFEIGKTTDAQTGAIIGARTDIKVNICDKFDETITGIKLVS